MTAAIRPPTPRSLADVHHALAAEMATLRSGDPPLFDQASALFKLNPQAKTDAVAAEALLRDIQALSIPASLDPALNALFAQGDASAPQTSIPLFRAPQSEPGTDGLTSDIEPATDLSVPPEPADPAPVLTFAAEVDAEDGEVTADDETDQGESRKVSPKGDLQGNATPALSAPPRVVTWTPETLGSGMLSQLARTLAHGDTLSLILTRHHDEVIVTVIPKPLKDENAATAIPLQVRGSPAYLDVGLADALSGYVAGRQIARNNAVDYAVKVQQAADASKNAAAKAKPTGAVATTPKSAPAPKPLATGTVVIEVRPRDAVLVVSDKAGKTYPVTEGAHTSLPLGAYTVTADADGYQHGQETFVVKVGKVEKVGLVLISAPQLIF